MDEHLKLVMPLIENGISEEYLKHFNICSICNTNIKSTDLATSVLISDMLKQQYQKLLEQRS